VISPEPLILPDPTKRFARTASRLEALSVGHPMMDWLRFMAGLAQAQHVTAAALGSIAGPSQRTVERAMAAHLPPLAAVEHQRSPVWCDGLRMMLDYVDPAIVPDQTQAIMRVLHSYSDEMIEALADGLLHHALDPADAGVAHFVAAALQVYFTLLAAGLDSSSLHLLPQRGLCPCCGSMPVSGVVTASGQTPGARYLYCSLCATAWNHVRAVCITCGESRSLSRREIEGGDRAVKAEVCDECHIYAKMLYQLLDVDVDPFADDLATLGLDLMVTEAGWLRNAPNALLLVG
jgi:FdhE protein